jgi:hypothetical protein
MLLRRVRAKYALDVNEFPDSAPIAVDDLGA